MWAGCSDSTADFSSDEVSEVELHPKFTFDDVAQAVQEAALGQGAGGHICDVMDTNLSKYDQTVVEVEFNISVFRED